MKNELMAKATRGLHKFGFKMKKHSPEILAITGTIGIITSAVMACKATTKLNTVLAESKEQIDQIHEYTETEGFSEKYTEEDSKKDLTIIHVQTGVKLVKLYAPSVVLGALSITAMLGSNHILRKRNIALAAAYTAVDKSFKDYRSRVVERFGEELDRELKYNIKAQEVEKKVIDEETGEEKTVTEVVNAVDPNDISEFARFFDESCPDWCKDPEANKMFLRKQQSYANNVLQCRGYLFLNEVYDMLGLPKTAAGQVVGWVYDEKNPIGDNYVDFGLYDQNGTPSQNEAKRLFVNGHERTVLLDFNTDGNILDYI